MEELPILDLKPPFKRKQIILQLCGTWFQTPSDPGNQDLAKGQAASP